MREQYMGRWLPGAPIILTVLMEGILAYGALFLYWWTK